VAALLEVHGQHVSPAGERAYTAKFALAPECGCRLACSAPNSSLARALPNSSAGPHPGSRRSSAAPGILGILVGQRRTERGQHGRAGQVLAAISCSPPRSRSSSSTTIPAISDRPVEFIEVRAPERCAHASIRYLRWYPHRVSPGSRTLSTPGAPRLGPARPGSRTPSTPGLAPGSARLTHPEQPGLAPARRTAHTGARPGSARLDFSCSGRARIGEIDEILVYPTKSRFRRSRCTVTRC